MSARPPYLISPTSTLRDAWDSLNASTTGICIVVDDSDRLLDTITDGDIRRAILDSISVDALIGEVSARKKTTQTPVTVDSETDDAEVLRLMSEHKILHIPVLDREGRVQGLKLMRDLVPQSSTNLDVLVMAGGFGKRLMPLTEDLPKPMLPIAGKPILEHIIGQLRSAQVGKVFVSTHYKPEAIQDYFGSGDKFGVDIGYLHETSPLGTAGALGFLDQVEKPLLVMNGDIMTKVDVRKMLAFHVEHGADITVGVSRYQFQVPFGVVDCEGSQIVALSEKPEISFFVSAGIYLLNPEIVKSVERGQKLDMPEVIKSVIAAGKSAASFPIVEYWLDVGLPAEYDKAQEDFEAPR